MPKALIHIENVIILSGLLYYQSCQIKTWSKKFCSLWARLFQKWKSHFYSIHFFFQKKVCLLATLCNCLKRLQITGKITQMFESLGQKKIREKRVRKNARSCRKFSERCQIKWSKQLDIGFTDGSAVATQALVSSVEWIFFCSLAFFSILR